MTADLHPAAFDRFLAVFPERDGGHDREAAFTAWRGALGRADAERIIAGAAAYAEASEGRERRFVMSPRRWLQEGRWRDATKRQAPSSALVFIAYGSPQWRAWDAFYRATRRKSPPQSRKGGWWFPHEFPPAIEAAE